MADQESEREATVQLVELRRVIQETKKLLAEAAANQDRLAEQLDALDVVIADKRAELRGERSDSKHAR
jgi:hypothetical protein